MAERKSVIPDWCGKSARHLMENFGFDPAILEGAIAAALHTERERAIAAADRLAEDCLSHSEQASAKGNKLQAKASIAQAKVLADFINLMRA